MVSLGLYNALHLDMFALFSSRLDMESPVLSNTRLYLKSKNPGYATTRATKYGKDIHWWREQETLQQRGESKDSENYRIIDFSTIIVSNIVEMLLLKHGMSLIKLLWSQIVGGTKGRKSLSW